MQEWPIFLANIKKGKSSLCSLENLCLVYILLKMINVLSSPAFILSSGKWIQVLLFPVDEKHFVHVIHVIMK